MANTVSNISSSRTDSSDNEEENCMTLNQLPPELINKILSYLDLEEICKNVALVCKKWHQFSQSSTLWRVVEPKISLSEAQIKMLISKAPLLKKINLTQQHKLCDEILDDLTRSCTLLQDFILAFCNDTKIGKSNYIWLQNCQNVTYLDVQGCNKWVTDHFLTLLYHVPKLRILNILYCNHITDEGLEVLPDTAPHLAGLYMDGVQFVTDSGVVECVRRLGQQMLALTVDGEDLTDESLNSMIQCCPDLSTFHASFSAGFSNEAIVQIKRLKTLTSLRLKKPSGTNSATWQELFEGPGLSSLTTLHLQECEAVTDEAVLKIARCCGKSLTKLDLSWCWNITDDGLSVIVYTCRNLQSLILIGLKRITEKSLIEIPLIQPLKFMDLTQCNKIEDETIEDIITNKQDLVVINYYGEEFRFDSSVPINCHKGSNNNTLK